MSNHAIPANFRRAATVAGALICVVVILAMCSEPAPERVPLSFAPGPPLERVRGFHLTAENILGLFVIGLISSTFGSMLGMGGGVMKMSCLLLFFGFHPGASKFAALFAYFVVAVGAAYRYLRLNFVMTDVVKILVPSSVLGIIFGAIIGHHLSTDMITMLLGMFLLYISVVMVKRTVTRYQDVSPLSAGQLASGSAGARLSAGQLASGSAPFRITGGRLNAGQLASGSAPFRITGGRLGAGHAQAHGDAVKSPLRVGWRIVLCGFPGGLLSAMLGISGGIVTTPLQQVLADIPIKNAIANTLLKATVTVPIACLMILVMGVGGGHFDFWTPVLVALCLVPGSIIGSQLGPSLTMRMSSVAMHVLLCAVALFMGINMLFFGN